MPNKGKDMAEGKKGGDVLKVEATVEMVPAAPVIAAAVAATAAAAAVTAASTPAEAPAGPAPAPVEAPLPTAAPLPPDRPLFERRDRSGLRMLRYFSIVAILVGATLLTPNGSMLYETAKGYGVPQLVAVVVIGSGLLLLLATIVPRHRGLLFCAEIVAVFVWGVIFLFYLWNWEARPVGAVAAANFYYLLETMVDDWRRAWSERRKES